MGSTGTRDAITEAGTVSRGLGVTDKQGATSMTHDMGGTSGIVSWYENNGSESPYGIEVFYDASANTILMTTGITGVNASTGAFTGTHAASRVSVSNVPSSGKFFVCFGTLAGSSSSYNIGIDANGVTPLGGIIGADNATGNYTSTTETAAATVSEMGIVVLYKNATGTATLNTDLIAQVSANGGSNYETVTLTAAGTFSTGINIAVANGVSISNTGTTPKYKISFANQSIASKDTQVHGVAMLY